MQSEIPPSAQGAGSPGSRAIVIPLTEGCQPFSPASLPQLLDALHGAYDIGEANSELLVHHHHLPPGHELLVH